MRADRIVERVSRGSMTRQGSPLDQQIKGVCRNCNMGWMKQIHERAKSCLVDLSKGQWWPLDDAEKTAVASYFTLVSMMWQLADKETSAGTQTERAHIMKTLSPPLNWWFFVAEHEQSEWTENLIYTGFSVYSASDMAKVNKIPKQPNCHSLVSTFGELAFNTRSIGDAAPEMFKRSPPEYALRLGLQTIWPLNNSVIRKPARPHTDAELHAIANFFYV